MLGVVGHGVLAAVPSARQSHLQLGPVGLQGLTMPPRISCSPHKQIEQAQVVRKVSSAANMSQRAPNRASTSADPVAGRSGLTATTQNAFTKQVLAAQINSA